MKSIITVLFLLCSSFSLYSQQYTFELDSAPYIPLDTNLSTSINKGAIWDDDTSFSVPIGFSFNLMNRVYSGFEVLLANLLFGDKYHNFSPLSGIVLKDRADSGASLSPISYILSGNAPSRVFKIEWKNAGFGYDTTAFANFQVWLYEGSNIIEARYGKSKVPKRLFQTQTGGPQVGIQALDNMGGDSFIFLLADNADSPKVKMMNDTGIRSLLSMPREGMIYRFKYHILSGINPIVKESRIEVFPNPAGDYINIRAEGPVKASLLDMYGKTVYKSEFSETTRLEVSQLPRGIYFLRINTPTKEETRKLMLK